MEYRLEAGISFEEIDSSGYGVASEGVSAMWTFYHTRRDLIVPVYRLARQTKRRRRPVSDHPEYTTETTIKQPIV